MTNLETQHGTTGASLGAPVIHATAIIGDPPEHREWLADQSQQTFEPLIFSGVRINSFVTVDAGIAGHTIIGHNCFLMTKTHVGHDAVLEEGCELAPGTIIGGHCTIGRRVKFGLGALVKPFVEIGDDARIGMGAVVTKNVPAGEVWAGNPARKLR